VDAPKSALWYRLEDESRRTILGFAFKLAFVLPFVALGRDPAGLAQTSALVFGLWCTVFAILYRQRAYGRNLNYWDEALWFFAVSHTTGLLT
jgi:hypothetical protein